MVHNFTQIQTGEVGYFIQYSYLLGNIMLAWYMLSSCVRPSVTSQYCVITKLLMDTAFSNIKKNSIHQGRFFEYKMHRNHFCPRLWLCCGAMTPTDLLVNSREGDTHALSCSMQSASQRPVWSFKSGHLATLCIFTHTNTRTHTHTHTRLTALCPGLLAAAGLPLLAQQAGDID